MYYLKKLRIEWVVAVLLIVLVFLLLGKIKVGEYADGFYIVRPTYWYADPTHIVVKFTSFYPSNLICNIRLLDKNETVEIPPRGSVLVTVEESFTPNRYVNIPVSLDCGVVKESGVIRAFVFT